MLKLNVEILAHAYDYLNAQTPFSEWNLPDSEDIRFYLCKAQRKMPGPKPNIFNARRNYAAYQWVGGHTITISTSMVGTHTTLLSSMAHEMIHLHQEQNCLSTRNPHDKAFRCLSDEVCKIHEFDRLIF